MACCGKASYEKNKAPNRKHITHQRAAISHTWCKNAKRPWQNLVLPRPLFPCPICAQRRPRITKSSGSCSRARQNLPDAPRGFLPSHGLPPTMAAFRRKAAQLQIQLRGKPRTLTGFLLSARHASQRRAEDDTMYSSCLQSDFFIAYFASIVNTHPKFVAVPASATNFFIFCAPGIDICNFPAII